MLTTRDTKVLLYDILSNDATLQTLLGTTPVNPKVFNMPLPEKADFPFVGVEMVSEERNALLCDQYGSDSALHTVNFHLWDERERSKTIDDVNERIMTLINETLPNDAQVEFRYVLKQQETEIYQENIRAHHRVVTYSILAVGK